MDAKNPGAAGNTLLMAHSGVEYTFTRCTVPVLNRYLEGTTLKKKPILVMARTLVRDCTDDATFKAIETLSVDKPAIWQTFANELLNDAGFSEDVEVIRKK